MLSISAGVLARLRIPLCCAVMSCLGAAAVQAQTQDLTDGQDLSIVQDNGGPSDPALGTLPTDGGVSPGATSVPLPSGVWAGISVLGALGLAHSIRRRKATIA